MPQEMPQTQSQESEELVLPAQGEPEFEVVLGSPPEEPAAPTPEETAALKAENDKLKAAIAAMESKEDPSLTITKSLTDGFDRLGNRLATPPAQAPTGVQEVMSEEEFNSKLMDNPSQYIDKKFQQHIKSLGSEIQQVLLNNQEVSRNFAMMDPEYKVYMETYGPEIEKVVASYPVQERIRDVNIYKKAAKTVKAEHIDDIVQKAVADALAKQQTQAAPAAQGRVTSFNETKGLPAPSGKKQVHLTPQEAAMCNVRGIKYEDYARQKYGK